MEMDHGRNRKCPQYRKFKNILLVGPISAAKNTFFQDICLQLFPTQNIPTQIAICPQIVIHIDLAKSGFKVWH